MEIERINNDVNGNPRFVIHFLSILTKEENEAITPSCKYAYAINKAHKLGGRKFHNKQFGGGIVFHAYNRMEVLELVYQFVGNKMFEQYKSKENLLFVNIVNGYRAIDYIFDDTDICNLFLKHNPEYGVISQFNTSIFVAKI